MGRRSFLLAVFVAAASLAAVTGAAAKLGSGEGRIGPDRALLGSGRHLRPVGDLVDLGNFPTGGALTRDGRFYWTLSTGRGYNDIRIVSLKTRKVVQTIEMPGLSGGIVMDPTRDRAFVSGVAESEHEDQKVDDSVPGKDGDVIHVFSYDGAKGKAERDGTIPVPPPPSALPAQDFPPSTDVLSWPDRLAISPDGRRLLVPLNLADNAAVVDIDSQDVDYVATGSYPYGAAILRDNKTGLVSNETPGTVSVIDLDTASKVKDIQVGPHLSHPEAIAVDPLADRAYVAIANSDQVAVIDTESLTVERTLSTARSEGDGTSPVDVEVTPDGQFLLVAEAGADEIAVFGLPRSNHASTPQQQQAEEILTHEAQAAAARHDGRRKDQAKEPEAETPAPAPGEPEADEGHGPTQVQAERKDFELIGRIPVSSYPADVDTARVDGELCRRRARSCLKLVWTAGKGLGVGPNPKGPDPYEINDDNTQSQHYLPTIVFGQAGLLDFPSVRRIRDLTPVASKQIRPSNAQEAPPDTPLAPGGPIKHVFYIVKENRTYDQVMGDDKRGDGDPNLALFGQQVTPNHHALARRFPLLDYVYANSEASIDGHFWTSAAKVSDYVHKNWNQNYGARKRPYDFGVYTVTWPQNEFLFDQLERQNISYFNYGEAIAGVVPLTDKDRNADETAQITRKLAKSDLGPPQGCYTNDAFIVKNAITQNPATDPSRQPGDPPNTESRFDCFKPRFTAQVTTGTVPAFSYLVLPQDHTEGATPGRLTPRAHVARNDLALGQIVDLISQSSIWPQTAIFVIEDDSQDGADHVDAHRIPAYVISPYAKRGAVVHTRYDFLSVIRSMELIIGLNPLGLFDQLATPMYDAFTSVPDNTPYVLHPATYDLQERNPDTPANAAMSSGLNLESVDRNSQRELDSQIWKTVHGIDSAPPPPGPNNTPGG